MIIRDAETKDADQLDLLLERLIHYEAQYDSNLNPNCRIRDNYICRIGLTGHKLLLIEKQKQLVGYLYGFIHHIPGVCKAPVAIVDALFIDENHRRKGYGSMLISRFKEFAAENGACQIELKVLSRNSAAVDLYEKLSFTETKKYLKMKL